MNATPRPWKYGISSRQVYSTETGQEVCNVHQAQNMMDGEGQANGVLIVRAVNSYDAMREALEAVAEEWERLECPLDHLGPQAPDWIRRVKTALALANGSRER